MRAKSSMVLVVVIRGIIPQPDRRMKCESWVACSDCVWVLQIRLSLALFWACHLRRLTRCFSAHVGQRVGPGMAGWRQSLQRPSSRAFCRCSWAWSRCCSLESVSCPFPVVLERLSQRGFHFGRGRFRAGLRLLGLRVRLSWRWTGGAFPWRLSCRFRPGGRAAALPHCSVPPTGT